MDKELKRSIILDNYQNPYNKDVSEVDGYIKINTNNESCIDNLDFMIKIKDDIIVDARFDGEACVISTSASSIMNNLIIGKTVDEVLNIIKNYEAMINEEEYDRKLLEEANCYDEIYKQANRSIT